MAILGTRYNNGMSNVNQNPCNCEPMCTTCGRPWVVCKGECGCKKSCCNNVNFCEYGKKVSGCLRSVEPSCPMQAVIPSVVVEDVTGLKNLADCFVHVTNINTTFYIDDKHRTMVTWAGPVEYDNYDLEANTLGLRSQFLIDHANDYAAYYNKTGEYQKFNFSEGGATTTQKLHVYCPEMEDYLNYSGGRHGRIKFGIGLDWETQDVVITDDSGSRLAPADLIDLGNDLIEYTIIVHVPQMDSVGPEEIIVPEQTFALSPAAVIPQDTGYMFGGTELAGESWHISLYPTGADTVIFANAYMGA